MGRTIDFSGPGYISFRDHVAFLESSNNYGEVDPGGHLGRYQFGEALLVELRYYTYSGDSTRNNNDFVGLWTGKDGVNNKQDFLENDYAQNHAFDQGMQYYWTTRIEGRGLDSIRREKSGWS